MNTDPSTPQNDPNLSSLGRQLLDTAGSKPTGPWVPPTAEELARLLPGYEVTQMLGRGGMGAVYMGRQKSLDRPVAIKILSSTLEETDAGFAERFKNEAKAMAKLSHPGIVAVHDFGETDGGLLYIVMEYVDGTDVARMIATNGRLHTEHAMAITAHVCDALAYAHERGIVHRDIKPANIMVGFDGVVKVADFGLAKVHSDSSTAGLTQSGMAMGTMHFMAPEMMILGSAVDQRADIYAVGVMLYQMLTGKLPQGIFELPSLQVPGLDPRYDRIISQAMREDRDKRYQTARDLRTDLDAILTQPVLQVSAASAKAAPAALPTQMRPQRPGGPRQSQQRPAPAARTPQPVPKSRSSLPTAVIVLFALGGGIWWFLQQQKETPQPSAPPVAARPAPAATVTVPQMTTVPNAPAPPPAAAPSVPAPAVVDAPPIALFNGRDLSGWELQPPNFPATVVNGAIRLRGSKDIPTSGNMYYRGTGTELPQWMDFEIICTVKTEKAGNSGIYLHAVRSSPDKNRAEGVEVQILNDPEAAKRAKHPGAQSGALQRLTGSKVTLRDGEWFQIKARVEGKHVQTWMKRASDSDWLPAADWTQPEDWTPPSDRPGIKLGAGTISFQNNPPVEGVVWVKDIFLRELNKPAPSTAAPSDSTPPATGDSFNGHRYQFIPGALTWTEAKAKAESMGGHLATVTSKEEHEWIAATYGTQISVGEMFFLGGMQPTPAQPWSWVRSEPFAQTFWASGEPNNATAVGRPQSVPPYYLAFYRLEKGMGWNDLSESDDRWRGLLKGFLVEWDPAPRPASAAASTADPQTLEEALLNYRWEWTHHPLPPDVLTFHQNGTASCPRFSWRWEITGVRTVHAFDSPSNRKWEATLTFDETLSTPEAISYSGKLRYTARRLDAITATPAAPPAASATPWIDTRGRTLTAKFVRMEGDNVVLDILGKTTPVALSSLSAESQQIAAALAAAASPKEPGFIYLLDDPSAWVQVGSGKMEIKDGVSTNSSPSKWGVAIYSRQQFSDFVLKAEFKGVDRLFNSGLWLRIASLNQTITDIQQSRYEVGISHPGPDLRRVSGAIWNEQAATHDAVKATD